MTPANIFRLVTHQDPTLLIDETDMESNEFSNLMVKVLNSGYVRGKFIFRVEKGENGKLVEEQFKTFGFKAIAGLDQLAQTLASRCIKISMVRNTMSKPVFAPQELPPQLKEMLSKYEEKYAHRINPANKHFINGVVEVEPMPPLTNRTIQLFYSLLHVAHDCSVEAYEAIYSLAKDRSTAITDEDRETVEAYVFRAYLTVKMNRPQVPVKEITEQLNKDMDLTDPRNLYKPKTVSSVMSRLGFKRYRKENERGFIADVELEKNLIIRYGSPEKIEEEAVKVEERLDIQEFIRRLLTTAGSMTQEDIKQTCLDHSYGISEFNKAWKEMQHLRGEITMAGPGLWKIEPRLRLG